MEKIAVLIITAVMAAALLRLMLLPIRILAKVGIYWLCGLICLWLINSISSFTGIQLPINLFTVLIAGFFGVPGIGILAILTML